ncbi:MAG: FAD-dependent oxidoreductase, partial [Gammaproteobacteria bacterium]|nr:FAD-dependent oxidoreductase [Gammaproteobacteria bacterium]
MSDFLIIGGGINGLLLARELAAAQADVVLLEKGECCREASWAGGGIVSPLYPWRYPAEITALATWAQNFYPELAQTLLSDTGIDPEFSQSGLLMLDAEDESQALQWATDNCRRLESVDHNFIYHHESKLAPGFGSGLWMPDVANIRNPQLGKALIADLQQRENVSIVQRCQVESFERKGAKVVAVESRIENQKRRFEAQQVILCTGAWSGSLARKLLVTINVEPVKGQMLLYRIKGDLVNSIVLTRGRYAIPRRDGHLLVGST